MTIQIDSDTLEGRLIRLLLEEKPITLEEAAKELKVSKKKLLRVCKSLVSRKIIQMEGPKDHTYLRLLRKDISFHGLNPSQERAVKHSKRNKKHEKEVPDMMYR